MSAGSVQAGAKVNLCLFLGAQRDDGRHELVTLFETASDLRDELVVTPGAGSADEVVCPGVSGPNLVADALAELRAAGWSAPPIRVRIDKRIPVAAGLGGGSCDAAAILRLAPRLSPLPMEALNEIAARLGADVSSQLDPGASVGTGAGEIVETVSDLDRHALLILPQRFGLATAEVYREADRLGLARPGQELAALHSRLVSAIAAHRPVPEPVPESLIVNDLQPAALSLRPQIAPALELAREVGSDQAILCGSGPTVIGIFWGPEGLARARRGAERLHSRFPGATASGVVGRGVLAPAPNE